MSRGKTTRMLQECLTYIRGGETQVLLVGVTHQHALDLRRRLIDMAEYACISLAGVDIKVTDSSKELAGVECLVFIDHHAVEFNPIMVYRNLRVLNVVKKVK